MTRHRPHQGIDLLLGAFLLASWVVSISPLLAAVLVIAVVGIYLTTIRRREPARTQRAEPPRTAGAHGRNAIDELETVSGAAPAIPLTGSARVDPSEIAPLVEEVRAAAVGSPGSDQAEKLARLVLGGRAVPLTDQVQVDRRRALKTLAKLRSSFGQAPAGPWRWTLTVLIHRDRGACNPASNRGGAALFQLLPGATDAALAGGLLLGVLDPADELVARQRCDVVPGFERRAARHERVPQVRGKRMNDAAGE